MDCSSCTKFVSSVDTYKHVAAPTFGSRNGETISSQIIRTHAHVPVGNDEYVVRGFVGQAVKAAALVVDCVAAGAEQQTDFPLGKFADQFFKQRERWIVAIHAENDFVFGIILAAETRVILVRVFIQPLNRLQTAYRGQKIGVGRGLFRCGKESSGAVQRQKVVDEGNRGNAQDDVLNDHKKLQRLLQCFAIVFF